MDSEVFFKVLAVVSPFLSGLVTYLLTQRSKKTEYLYEHRIPAFKRIFKALILIERFAEGKVALERGAEFSPYFDEPGSPLDLRTRLAKAREENDIFLTEKSRESCNELDSSLGILCSAVINQKNPDGTNDYDIDYEPLLRLVKKTQNIMYKEIDLPNS